MKIKILDKVIDRRIALFYFIYEALVLLKNIILYHLGMNVEMNAHPLKLAHVYIIDWLVVVSYMSLISHFFKKRLIKSKIETQDLIIHFSLSLLLGLAIFFFVYFILFFLGQIQFNITSFKGALIRTLRFVDSNFLVYFSLLGIIYSFYYFENLKKVENRYEKLKSSLYEAKLSQLKSQIDPHFIFNTLNSISALIDINPIKAQKAVSGLGTILRESIKKNTYLVPLKDDLQIIENYIEILKTRFEDDLIVEFFVEKESLDKKTPNFLIQPIIENAVKHGFTQSCKLLKISIIIKIVDNQLIVLIRNNGAPLNFDNYPTLFEKGTGLGNIKERLELIYGKRQEFKIKNLPDLKGVEVTVKIPVSS